MSCEKSASIVAFEFLGISASTSEILRRGGVAGLSTATAWWSSSTTTSRPCRTFSNAAAKFFATSASLMWICAIDSIIAPLRLRLRAQSCLIQDEPGAEARFSHKMSLGEKIRMLGVDNQRANRGTVKPGADPGVSGGQ